MIQKNNKIVLLERKQRPFWQMLVNANPHWSSIVEKYADWKMQLSEQIQSFENTAFSDLE